MTIYEYNQALRDLRNAERRNRRAIERGDEPARGKACHDIEDAMYRLGRLTDQQTRITRSMCEGGR
jgi:hypothetical protein